MSFRFTPIKSIQRGTITLTGVTSNTATITSVNTSYAAASLLGYKNSDTTYNNEHNWIRIDLTNATTVTATRPGATGTVVVSFEVIEWNQWAIRSLQTVSISFTGTSQTATLGTTLTSTAKTMIVWGGNTSTPTAPADDSAWCSLVVTNTTTITAARNTAAGTAVVNGTVVEFKWRHRATRDGHVS